MKILVAIDSSSYAEQVLEAVANRAWPIDGEVHLLTCVAPAHEADTQEVYSQTANAILAPRVSYLVKALPGVTITAEVQIGNAAETILDAAKHWNADLIVIGSHGDTGVRAKTVGSVAAAVVNQAPCSVDVVKVGRRRKVA